MRGAFVTFALVGALAAAGCTSTSGHPDTSSGPVSTSAPAVVSPGPTSQAEPTSGAGTLGASDPPGGSSTPSRPVGTEVPADVPTTGPNLRHKGERPPVMPLLATKHTPAGAVAFAKFFIKTIDWGFATTSGAYMRHYFLPSCGECISHAVGLDNTQSAGGHYVGGRFRIRQAELAPVGHHHVELSVVVTFDVTAEETLNSHGTFMNGEIAHLGAQRQLWLKWDSRGWTITDMAPVP